MRYFPFLLDFEMPSVLDVFIGIDFMCAFEALCLRPLLYFCPLE